jgi:hypothetical protein
LIVCEIGEWNRFEEHLHVLQRFPFFVFCIVDEIEVGRVPFTVIRAWQSHLVGEDLTNEFVRIRRDLIVENGFSVV